VICGFGRTGNMWGCQTYDIKPDILTCAKALSSAYLPISAVMVSEPIFQGLVKESEKLGIFGHGFTYSAHPVCAAVALRAQQLMLERDMVGHVRRVSPRFQQHLLGFASHPLVGEARGVGLIGGIELSADKAKKTPFDPKLRLGQQLQALAQEEGLIIRAMPGDILGFCPPLIITEPEIDELFDRFGRALNRFADQLARAARKAAE